MMLLPFSTFGQKKHLFISDTIEVYDVVGERTIPLKFFNKSKALVFIFTGTNCPYFDLYFERIKSLQKKYSSDGIRVVLLDSNTKPFGKLSLETHQRTTVENIPIELLYLSDASKTVKRTLNVKIIPEVVVLVPRESGFSKAYQGPIDNSPLSASSANKKYVEELLDKILINQPYRIIQKHPIGCRIR